MSVSLGLAFCVFFWFSLGFLLLVLFAYVVLSLVSSVLAKRLAGKNRQQRLQNDLFVSSGTQKLSSLMLFVGLTNDI